MHPARRLVSRWLIAAALLGPVACGSENPTAVVVDDDYPAVPGGGDPATETTVYKVWWVTALLADPVAPGHEGASQRTVPSTDYAYAVLARGWDPSSSTPPAAFVAARSVAKLTASRGDTLHVRVSADRFVGDCAAGHPLSQEDADFVTQRIFPDEFASGVYDANACRLETPSGQDAGGGDGP